MYTYLLNANSSCLHFIFQFHRRGRRRRRLAVTGVNGRTTRHCKPQYRRCNHLHRHLSTLQSAQRDWIVLS